MTTAYRSNSATGATNGVTHKRHVVKKRSVEGVQEPMSPGPAQNQGSPASIAEEDIRPGNARSVPHFRHTWREYRLGRPYYMSSQPGSGLAARRNPNKRTGFKSFSIGKASGSHPRKPYQLPNHSSAALAAPEKWRWQQGAPRSPDSTLSP